MKGIPDQRYTSSARGQFMRFVILHYHIFKNAGTTVENLLRKNFPHSFARFESEGRDAQLSAAELLEFVHAHPEVQAISSHHLRYPRPHAPGFVFFDLLFLRDPIDRLRSIYTFFRQSAPSD
ncbi:MAG: sulfotransferase family 2 domain-containing protein, partial [Terriglobales bacterium]